MLRFDSESDILFEIHEHLTFIVHPDPDLFLCIELGRFLEVVIWDEDVVKES